MPDWERLGSYVVTRRVELGYKTRQPFSDASGISTRILGDIETGRRGGFDRTTIANLERTLKWATGSALRITEGGEPVALSAPAANAPAPGQDAALIRVMRSTELGDDAKAKIVKMLIAEQERFARERAARAEELIQAFRDDG